MASSMTCKLIFGDEIRRFNVNLNEVSFKSIFDRAEMLLGLGDKKFNLQYKDDEGDVITMSTDEEMGEAVALALSSSPPILRLNVALRLPEPDSLPTAPGVSERTKDPAIPDKENRSSDGQDLAAVMKSVVEQLPKVLEQCSAGPFAPDAYCSVLKGVCDSLPKFVDSLPPDLKANLPNVELDLAATIAKNAAAAAENKFGGNVSFSFSPPAGCGDKEVHPGVTCDKSGMCPIVGPRFNLKGHNYDLCEAEFNKLDSAEQARFVRIEPPFGGANRAYGRPGCRWKEWKEKPEWKEWQNGFCPMNDGFNCPTKEAFKEACRKGVHPGVTCDKSGMRPIVGPRFNLKGHNYDLCEAEFNKLDAAEQAKFVRIEPPCVGGPWKRPWKSFQHGGGGCAKLAARFVSDVSIFDGTQMAPGTKFTKIWRLKNAGEVAWPEGARLLFVGGDQMSAELSVPVGRMVMPGDEVDLAVDMVAPDELGRYLGYWRLVGPMGRRRFGQRIWCHIQVVDPTGTEVPHDPSAVEAEISSLMARASHEDDEDGPDAEAENEDKPQDETRAPEPAYPAPAVADTTAPEVKQPEPKPPEVNPPEVEPAGSPAPTAAVSVGGESMASSLISGVSSMLSSMTSSAASVKAEESVDAPMANAQGSAPANTSEPEPDLATQLMQMGFDERSVQLVLEKNTGPAAADEEAEADLLEACTRDLLQLSEWDSMLDDLEEMGFGNRDLNKRLMVKNNGSVKRTVKDLVTA